MIYLFFKQYPNVLMAMGALFTYVLTGIGTYKHFNFLPTDQGRDFAVDGQKSVGKPRGAGLIFVVGFILGSVLFAPIFTLSKNDEVELLIYLLLTFIEMMTGYLDDKAEKPWGPLKKGLLDLFVSLVLAVTYIYSNGCTIGFWEYKITLNPVVFGILIIVMCWGAINVTNCADGVDGLSTTLGLLSLISFLITDMCMDNMEGFEYMLIFFIASLVAYLWYNAGPSLLLMGDAGSRAIGLFLCMAALKTHHPLLFIPFSFVIILDGGLGLFKIFVIKVTKNKQFMNKIRTPLHDHVRKNFENNWSNTQCVTRFAIIQCVISIVVVYAFVM